MHYNRGRQQLASQEFTQAIKTFNLILNYDPGHAEAYFYRGLAKYQLSDYSGAEADFTNSIKIKPYKTEALYYRGLLKVQKSRYLEAFHDVQQAIELDDRHPEYFITRGWLHLEYGDTAGAVADYTKAISLDPYLDNAHLNLGTIYMHQGKFKLAERHSDSAEMINPHNPSIQLTRGNISQLQEKYVDAIEQFQLVLSQDSLNARAWFYTALCHQSLGNYHASLVAYNRTIELNRNNALGYYNRGLLYMEHEKYEEALTEFDMVVRLSPKNIYAWYIRGIIKTRLEDFKGAEVDFSAAIDLYPNLIHAYQNRSVTRMAQNDLQGYTEDKNTVDSLLSIGVPGFDLTEISYLKTITDLNADFIPAERVRSSMVQYSTRDVEMIPVFIITPRIDQYDQAYKRVEDLQHSFIHDGNRYMLELKSLDQESQTPPDNTILSHFAASLPESGTQKTVILNSLILSWQMKYRDAISLLDESGIDSAGNYLAAFIRGNHNVSIAGIIASIESREAWSDEADNTVREYYDQAIEDYSIAVDLNPGFSYAWFNRAYIYSYTDQLEAAVLDYNQCIKLDPSLGEAYYNRGLLSIYMNSIFPGCTDLSKAGELGIDAAYKVIYKYCKE